LRVVAMRGGPIAFSSEVGTGLREENASKQQSGASVLIQPEPIML
jgi:heme iron utilization protein